MLNVFEAEKKKLEQRKKSIDQVEVSKDKIYCAVQSGFEKAKKERLLKRNKLIKRSSWSIVIAATLFISFITSINVSPVFASKVSSIPGMEAIVNLLQKDKDLIAAVENDFYQPLNLSQEKNGITVSLDGVMADQKGIVIFYTVHSKKKNLPLEIESLQLKKEYNRNLPVLNTTFYSSAPPTIEEKVFSSIMTLETIENERVANGNLLWSIDLKTGDKVEQFQIPFKLKKSEVKSKTIDLSKEVVIEGQRIIIESVTINPIRAEVKLKVDPNNSKKIFSFNNLKFTNDLGDEWVVNNRGTAFRSIDGNEWRITLQSPYFNKSDQLKLEFGKIAAIDKKDAFILIDTEAETFLKQPADLIFSNLEVENNKFHFTIDNTEAEDIILISSSFSDSKGKKYDIKYDFSNILPNRTYVEGSVVKTDEKGLKFEFVLPTEAISNPIRFDLVYYPSWIEADVERNVN